MAANSFVAFVSQIGPQGLERAGRTAVFDVEQDLPDEIDIAFHGCTSVCRDYGMYGWFGLPPIVIGEAAEDILRPRLTGQDESAGWMIARGHGSLGSSMIDRRRDQTERAVESPLLSWANLGFLPD